VNRQRLQEITNLRDAYGDSTDQRWAPAYLALDELLAELDAAAAQQRKERAESARAARAARCPLTEKQHFALVDAANGVTSGGHAEAAGLSIHTVKSRRSMALMVLRTHSLAQAVAVCMAEGWITPDDIKIPERWR
jgi:DNA-binding NarL/FixJ family response regulator